MIPAHELTFGDLVLTGATQPGAWTYTTLGENLTFGIPQPIEQTIATLLQDGSLVVTRGHDNREAGFQITISAPDSITLAEGEKALFLECSKPNLLTWRPPDGVGAISVFEVFTSSLEPIFDDVKELLIKRTYRLRLVCYPFTRSVDEIVTEALTVGPTPTTVTISDGTSTTGWSGGPGTFFPIAVESGHLNLPYKWQPGTPVDIGGGVWLRSGLADATMTIAAVDFTATPFVSFEVTPGTAATVLGPEPAQLLVDGVAADLIASESLPNRGIRYGFRVLDTSATTLRVMIPFGGKGQKVTAPTVKIQFDNLKRTNQPPGGGARSSVRTVDVDGSGRTQGSLQLAHPTAGLGDVILYSAPVLSSQLLGYRPDLARWQTGGGRTTDANNISGAFGGALTFDVPIDAVPPGGYALVARLFPTGASVDRRLYWKAETRVNGVVVGTAESAHVKYTLAARANYTLPGLVLPPTDVALGANATVRITLLTDDSTSGWSWDELWAFYLDDEAALTMVSCGAGTPSAGTVHSQLWVDSPSVLTPRARVYVGTMADRLDAFHADALAKSWDLHSFRPGQMLVYIANSGATLPSLTTRYYPRWFTHAV